MTALVQLSENSVRPVTLVAETRIRLSAPNDPIEVRLAKARGQVDALTQPLLAKAFRGELVPQDPTDEWAESLFERIRTQKM